MSLGHSGLVGQFYAGGIWTTRDIQDLQAKLVMGDSGLPGPIGSAMFRTFSPECPRLIGPAVINTIQIIKEKCLGLGDCIGSLLFRSKQDYQARMGLKELM